MTSDPTSPELSPIKRALLEIRGLRAQLEQLESAQSEPIAILGLGLRFPGDVADAAAYWRLLTGGVDAIGEIPPERWSLDEFYDPDISIPGKMTTRYGAFLQHIDAFDAAFFGISPREAISMDPQQRLLLETSWEALENAGQSTEKLLDTQTGVFIGICNSDYYRMLIRDPQKIDTYASTGGTLSVAAGRIAYLLGLHGPALAVDTACSSSLVAVHLACHSLRQKECDLALVGGVNLILTPEANINFSKAGMMAEDGRCKTFDAAADGYVRGEGCGMIVLKRLSAALADHDPILALVCGSAINQDGRSSGLTAPNGPAQEAVIRSALRAAGLEPQQVDYVEAHGTGTSLGDPIEVRALGAVYGAGRQPDHPLRIGSVKTNIGHLEAAAGIAGLIKVVLMLREGHIPPHLHFKTPNPHIAWADYPLAVPVQGQPWPEVAGGRAAGVSSFGFSGTNAHVILKQAPPAPPLPEASPRPLLFPLSAKSPAALRAYAGRVADVLAQRPLSAAEFRAFVRTAGVGRTHYAQRLAVCAATSEQLRAQLAAFAAGQTGAFSGWQGQAAGPGGPPLVFLFTGHGSHYVQMGRKLYENVPIFRQTLQRCAELLRPYLPLPLLEVLYPPTDGDPAAQAERLNDMTYGQPAMFALEYALAQMWQAWGVQPAALIGHSLGEYAAAALAGVLSLEDALKLIAERGRLMQQLPEDGLMVTIFAEEARVTPVLAPFAAQVSIAAINSPDSVVISGQRAAVLQVVEALTAQGLRAKALNISRAAHSPMVDAMLPGIRQTTASLRFAPPQIEFFSSVTGALISQEMAQPAYWQRHLRQTVRFAAAVQAAHQAGYRSFLEVGPHPTLINLGQRSVPEEPPSLWLPSLRQGLDDWQLALESLAQLYVQGAALEWAALDGELPAQKMPLPTYPWEKKSYWWQADAAPTPPAPAPAWPQAVAAAQRQSQQAPLALEVSGFAAKWAALNRLTGLYIYNALHTLGAFSDPGQPLTPAALLERCAILPTYRHLLARWLKHLADAGLLAPVDGGAYACSPAAQPLPTGDARATAQAALADAPFVWEYVEACGERLAAILTGRESPLELMFPGGSLQRAEALYQHWAHARYFNDIVGAVAAAVAQAAPTRPLRLLEIGAGTGATTAAVLPLLPADRSEYHFTDVSELFLERARQKFADFPFVRYGLLNIEKDGLEQGYGRGQFDVVIAANVIHATHSLSETLQNARQLLAPGGLLVLFEATTHQPWFDITTGLIEGWQSFGDDLRNDSPLLSAAQWQTVLQAAGFPEVAAYPAPGSPAEILGETVLLARPQPGQAAAIQLEHAPAEPAPAPAAQPQTTPADLLQQQLREALPNDRKDLLLQYVRAQVMQVLRLEPGAAPERSARLMDLGVDSLMALELRGRLSLGLKLPRKLPATLIFDYPTIAEIVDFLLRDVLSFEPPQAAPTPAPAAPQTPTTPADLENISDAEVEEMLLAKLKKRK